ncbi:hypothetical protein QYM36_007826 [Artemia franciscana]|uniref:Small ribosomal subunit protein uS7 domain-containing protein n=1 Tax=Artemia franciscana TaxID=6661 RepID=A0AA88IUP4_ARTSF|nr:hypothetical protein QYM36_007826 [Artemia franciscana]
MDDENWETDAVMVATAPAPAELPEVKLFGRWSCEDVQVSDMSLQDYIAVKEKYAKFIPHSAGRYAAKRFRKAQCPIVERVTNSLMMHGRNNGKKLMAVRIMKHAMEIIHLLTGENPLQVLVNAIINSGPREDSTRIGRAGTVRRQAVDVSPLRRVNQVNDVFFVFFLLVFFLLILVLSSSFSLFEKSFGPFNAETFKKGKKIESKEGSRLYYTDSDCKFD